MSSAHIDTFARDNLPPVEQQPQFLFDLPELQFPSQLNCASALLDRHVTEGNGGCVCIRAHRYQHIIASNRLSHGMLNRGAGAERICAVGVVDCAAGGYVACSRGSQDGYSPLRRAKIKQVGG